MRLVNKVTGVRISVSEDAARRLGSEWERVAPPREAPAKKAAPRRRATKKSDSK